jgi:ABC-type nitrate/sulfonate/bicarbonate transport system permease component
MKRYTRLRWLPLLLAVLVLIVWEIGARFDLISALFFPKPSTIAQTLVETIRSGEIVTALTATLSRLSLGLLIGGGFGLVLGLGMGWSRPLRLVVDPIIAAFHPIPKISVFPLIMIVFGIGEASKVAIIAISTFFPMLINTMAGVRQISPIHFEVAENYGANRFNTFTHVVLPGSLPLVLVGTRLALNTALVITIAVELLTAREGLGAMIWLAWETFRTEELYASLLVTALLGFSFNRILQFINHRFLPWHVSSMS